MAETGDRCPLGLPHHEQTPVYLELRRSSVNSRIATPAEHGVPDSDIIPGQARVAPLFHLKFMEPLLTSMSENVLPQQLKVINVDLEVRDLRTVVQNNGGTEIVSICWGP